jgi:MFS family permease
LLEAEAIMGNDTTTLNRWLVVVGAILIQLALGAIYAWSVFTARLTAGRVLPRVGPRLLTVAGGLLLGSGYLLGGLFGDSFWIQLLSIGIVGGAGIGLAYVVPISVCVKWFPDKKGLITGMAVAGFGFGATIWVKLAGSWFGGLLNTTSVFGLPGVQSVFVIYGIALAALVLLGSFVMVNPPDNYLPSGWTDAAVLHALVGLHVCRRIGAHGDLLHQAVWYRCARASWRGRRQRHHGHCHGLVRDFQRRRPHRLGQHFGQNRSQEHHHTDGGTTGCHHADDLPCVH